MVFLITQSLKTRLLDIIYLAQGLDWEIGEGKASGQGFEASGKGAGSGIRGAGENDQAAAE